MLLRSYLMYSLVILSYPVQLNYTPLMFACQDGFNEVAKLLIKRGAALEVRSEVRGHNYDFLYVIC